MHPDPEHGCSARARGWCNPNRTSNEHQCPWKPADLGHMLAEFETKPFGYNEVLVSTVDYAAKMPELIEAFIWVQGVTIGRRARSLASSDKAAARAVHAGFLRAYPHAQPRLFKLDLSADRLEAPFIELES